MILPTKHIPQDRALLTIGANILSNLAREKTVSTLWEVFGRRQKGLTYDWFVLSLDLLYAMGLIEMEDGRLYRRDLK